MAGKGYQDLVVWQKAMDLVEQVYQLTMGFPKEELYGLISQIRRAAISVPSNIAEGHGQGGEKNFQRYLAISLGSLKELETQLIIAKRLGYLPQSQFEPALKQCDEIGKMITGLRKSLGGSW